MDLAVKEVSELLNVSEEQLLEWIDEGKIPAYSIQNQYRFSRTEIEEWLLEHPRATKKGDKQEYNLFRAINKGDVLNDLSGSDKETVIRTVMHTMAPRLDLDPEVLAEMVIEREQLMSTGVGLGFAIPHVRDFHLPNQVDVVTVVFLKQPIAYGALDDEPVHTLFFLLASDDKRHLRLLAKVAHLIGTEKLREELKKRPGKRELLELVRTWEAGVGGGA